MFTHTFNSQDFFVNLLVHEHHDLSSPLTNLPIYEIEPEENVLRLDENGKWDVFDSKLTDEKVNHDRVLLKLFSAQFESMKIRQLVFQALNYIPKISIEHFEKYCDNNDLNEQNYFSKALIRVANPDSHHREIKTKITDLPFVNENLQSVGVFQKRFDNNIVYLFPEPDLLGVWISDNDKGFGGMFRFQRAVGVIL